jgi:hypothetical protein
VTLATSDGTGIAYACFTTCISNVAINAAIAGSDYVSVSMDVVFPTGASNGATQCVSITITHDSAVEGDETFTVSLTTSSLLATPGNAMATITIIGTKLFPTCYYLYYLLLKTADWEHNLLTDAE